MGLDIVLISRNAEKLSDVAAEIGENNTTSRSFKADTIISPIYIFPFEEYEWTVIYEMNGDNFITGSCYMLNKQVTLTRDDFINQIQ